MKWAELVLSYVDVLVWPVVVALAIWVFKKPISDKLNELRTANVKGVEATFDRAASVTEEWAEAASEAQPEPDQRTRQGQPPDTEGARELFEKKAQVHGSEFVINDRDTFEKFEESWDRLRTVPSFDEPRKIASVSPQAAVILAYGDVETVARAAWQLLHPLRNQRTSTGLILRMLTDKELFEFRDVSRSLVRLRNQAAHSGSQEIGISPAGAEDYIGACEQFTSALTFYVQSRVRHPSWSLEEWGMKLRGDGGDEPARKQQESNQSARPPGNHESSAQ